MRSLPVLLALLVLAAPMAAQGQVNAPLAAWEVRAPEDPAAPGGYVALSISLTISCEHPGQLLGDVAVATMDLAGPYHMDENDRERTVALPDCITTMVREDSWTLNLEVPEDAAALEASVHEIRLRLQSQDAPLAWATEETPMPFETVTAYEGSLEAEPADTFRVRDGTVFEVPVTHLGNGPVAVRLEVLSGTNGASVALADKTARLPASTGNASTDAVALVFQAPSGFWREAEVTVRLSPVAEDGNSTGWPAETVLVFKNGSLAAQMAPVALPLLLALAVLGAGFYFWDRRRRGRDEEQAQDG